MVMNNSAMSDALYDALRAKRTCPADQWDEFEKRLDADMPEQYRYISCINMDKPIKKREQHKRERKNTSVIPSQDDCSIEEDDPQCVLYWEMLKLRGTYKEESGSDSEREAEGRRDDKHSSGVEQDDLVRTDQCGDVETVARKGKGVLKKKSYGKRNIKVGKKHECEAERRRDDKHSSSVQPDDLVRTDECGHVETVARKGKGVLKQKSYGKKNIKVGKKHGNSEGKAQHQRKQRNETKGESSRAAVSTIHEIKPEYSSDQDPHDVGDVMVLDPATISREVTSGEYRNLVLNEMRKPYNEEEYAKLSRDIQDRQPVKRHMDLRNGRERLYSFDNNKSGKSLLDHHPDLKRKLAECCGVDKPKRLKIMRGFFFWLQNLSQEKAFRPWQDLECLAVVQREP